MDSRFRLVPYRNPYSPIPELTLAEGEQVDRISSLPDVLLSFILSFLSTKEAVATSILSKRWESIWTKVPALNFSLKSGSANDFKAFVDRVLLCNDSPSLRLFHLSGLLSNQISDYHYHSWIRNIMRRDVVEMDLVHVGGILPAGTFSSKKLTVLKLFGLRTPFWGSFHLPSLLTLHFKFVELPDDLPLKNILISLPQLEELVLFKCLGSKNMCIYSSSLKRLEIVEEMVFPRRIERTTIDCPSLEYLQIYGGQISEYRYGNMPSLTEARLHVGLNSKERYDVDVISVLNHASNLMTLKLDIATKKSAPGYTKRDQCPLFPNLTHVIVDYNFSSTNCSNFSWRYLVLWILQCAPNIVSFDYFSSKDGNCGTNIRLGDYLPRLGQLNLEEFLPHFDHPEEYQPQLPAHSTLPKCMFPTLEVVNASLLDVADADKILLEYLLNNAVNLKVVRINFKGSKVDENNMDAIIEWLNKVPRASSECKLIVSPP